MLWYLHLCAVAGVVVTSYRDDADATMTETDDGGGHFTEAILRPAVTVASAEMIQTATSLHKQAHAKCFIANSVNFPIRHEPVISAAGLFSDELVAGGAVHVGRDVALMTVAGSRGVPRLEHEDRGTEGRRRPVFGSLGDDEDVALAQADRPLATIGIPEAHVKLAVEDEEELIGVLVHMPDVIALGVRDPDRVIVDMADDARAVDVLEAGQRRTEVDRGHVIHNARIHWSEFTGTCSGRRGRSGGRR
jgi:hypothetical protein